MKGKWKESVVQWVKKDLKLFVKIWKYRKKCVKRVITEINVGRQE